MANTLPRHLFYIRTDSCPYSSLPTSTGEKAHLAGEAPMVFLLNKSPVPNITGSDTPSQARFLGCLSQLLLLVPRMGGVMPGMEKPVMYQNAALL